MVDLEKKWNTSVLRIRHQQGGAATSASISSGFNELALILNLICDQLQSFFGEVGRQNVDPTLI